MKTKKIIQPIHFISILFCVSFILGLTACNEDSGEEEIYPKTSYSKIQLTELIKTDAPTVTSTQTYAYTSGRLTSYTTQQSFTAVEYVEIESHATATYSKHQAVIADEFGNISTYALDDKGYAISCIRKEGGGNTRTYTFSYLTNTEGKQYLKNITETLEDGKVYSSIDIDYSTYSTLSITYQVDTFQQVYTATTSSMQETPNSSKIPSLFLTELHPLSMHTIALYGKLLGDPLDTLITQVIPDGNTENNETTTYTYTTNEHNIVTSCQAVTNSYGTNYVRTITYVIQ